MSLPAPEAPVRPLHQLPAPPQGFVGRTEDLRQLRAREHEDGVVLTGLRGMGGIGKTALALVLAQEWTPRYPDAQLFLDGRGLSGKAPSATALMEQVIRAFHPGSGQLPDDPDEITKIYREILTGKKVLILLDNATGEDQARPLIPPTGCALLVTSRRGFTLGTTAAHRVGELSETESISLLRKWYGVLSNEDASALARLLCGLPLALSLAGARLAMDASDRGGAADVSGYLKELKNGRLKSLDGEADETRETAVSETLRLSENSFTQEQRDAWRRLGVFTASFAEPAAQAVAHADAAMLRRFVRLSLLDREADRYKMHDLAAEYARGTLSEDELTAVYFAYVGYYIAVGYEANNLYLQGGEKVLESLHLYDREQAHLEAAFEWLLPRQDDASARALICLVDSIVFTGQSLRFHPRKRIHWLEAQRDAARLAGERQAEANALGNLGNTYLDLGETRKASEFYEQLLAMARELSDRKMESLVLGNLGNVQRLLGNMDKAIELSKESLEISRARGDRSAEVNALGNLGSTYLTLGKLDKATEYYQESLDIARKLGDREAEGHELCDLGRVQLLLGNTEKAVGFFEQSLNIAQQIGDRRVVGDALWYSALAFARLENLPAAIQRAEASLEIREEMEHPDAAQVREYLAQWRSEEASSK